MSAEAPEPVTFDLQLQLKWPSRFISDAQYVNMFAATPGFPSQGGPEEVIYLLAGAAPPPMFGDAGAVEEFRDEGAEVPIKPVASLVFPLSRARELVRLLSGQIAAADERVQPEARG
jgi:hypothetical protein